MEYLAAKRKEKAAEKLTINDPNAPKTDKQ